MTDSDMDIFPTDLPPIGLIPAVPAGTVAYPIEARQQRDAHMDQLPRMFAHAAQYRLGLIQVRKSKPDDLGQQTHGGWEYHCLQRDVLLAQALPPQRDGRLERRCVNSSMQPMTAR